MLTEHKVAFTYREYTKDPLSETEVREVLEMLDVPIKNVLRRNDKAFKDLGLTGDEDDDTLITLIASHPTLLQRPIAHRQGKAVVGRPHERLLELL